MKKPLAVLIGVVIWAFLLFLIFNESPEIQRTCTTEAMVCPDGSTVSRELPNCEFKQCPQPKWCDALHPCNVGEQCIILPNTQRPLCYAGNPCDQCITGRCTIQESDPAKVVCN